MKVRFHSRKTAKVYSVIQKIFPLHALVLLAPNSDHVVRQFVVLLVQHSDHWVRQFTVFLVLVRPQKNFGTSRCHLEDLQSPLMLEDRIS